MIRNEGVSAPILGMIASENTRTQVCGAKTCATAPRPYRHWTYVWRMHNRPPPLLDLTLDRACGNVWRMHNRNHGGDDSVNFDLTLDRGCGNVWRMHNRNHGRDGGEESVNVGGSEMHE
jgi:hypothetical protein